MLLKFSRVSADSRYQIDMAPAQVLWIGSTGDRESSWEIDFKPPLAARLYKDWSYLGVTG